MAESMGPKKPAPRQPAGMKEVRSLIAAGSRRDLALAFVWAAIFAGCYFLVRLGR